MFICCGIKKNAAINPINSEFDMQYVREARLYGISVQRYKTLLNTPNMTVEKLDYLHMNGWDFTDKQKDLELFVALIKKNDEINA
jgi:hypothetical protein